MRQSKPSIPEFLSIRSASVSSGLRLGCSPSVDGQLMDLSFGLDGFTEKDIASLYEIERKAIAFVDHESCEYIVLKIRMAEMLSALARNLQSNVYLNRALGTYEHVLCSPVLLRIPLARVYIHSCIVGTYFPFFEYEADFDPAFDSFEIAIKGYPARDFPVNHAMLNGWIGVLHAWTALSTCVTGSRIMKEHAEKSLDLLDRAREGTLQLDKLVDPGLIVDSARIAREILDSPVEEYEGEPGDGRVTRGNIPDRTKTFRKARDIVKSEGKLYGKQNPLDKWFV